MNIKIVIIITIVMGIKSETEFTFQRISEGCRERESRQKGYHLTSLRSERL